MLHYSDMQKRLILCLSLISCGGSPFIAESESAYMSVSDAGSPAESAEKNMIDTTTHEGDVDGGSVEASAPEGGAPEGGAPKKVTPEGGAPKDATPEASVPEASAPDARLWPHT